MSIHPEEPLTEEHLDGIFDMLDSLTWRRRELTCNSNCVTITMLEKQKKEMEASFRKELHTFSNEIHKIVEGKQNVFQFRTEQLERELKWYKQEVEMLKNDLEREKTKRHEFERKFSQQSVHTPNAERGVDSTCLECSQEGTLAIIPARSPPQSLPLQPPEFRKEVMELLQNLSNTIRHEISEWDERHQSLQEELGKTKKDVDKLILKVFPIPVVASSLPSSPPLNVSVSTLAVLNSLIEDISPAVTPAPVLVPANMSMSGNPLSLPPPPPSPRTVAASSALLELGYRGSPVETSNHVPVIKFSEPRDEKMIPVNLSRNFLPNANRGEAVASRTRPPKVIVNYGILHGTDGDRPLFCVCGKRCSSRTDLDGHIRYHTIEKRFTCNFCGRNFRYAYSLRRHFMRVHNKII